MKIELEDVSHLAAKWTGSTQAPTKCFRSTCLCWTVQVFPERNGWFRIGIRKSNRGNPYRSVEIRESWSFLQDIKEHVYPGRLAIELYPEPGDVIDVANMRWIYIAPKGYVIPFNLNANKSSLGG